MSLSGWVNIHIGWVFKILTRNSGICYEGKKRDGVREVFHYEI